MLVLLLFLPPMLGELLSGSSPPLAFFSGGIIFLVLLYGCGTVLIRELRTRWNLQWSVIFLAVAYGILEEGTMIQSFFNVDHVDLGILSGYGMFFGVQWPWSIALTVYHATVSTLIPIVIVDYIWPEYKNEPLLKGRGFKLCGAGFVFVILFFLVFAVLQKEPPFTNYDFSVLINVITLMVVGVLIWLAYKFKDSRILSELHIVRPALLGVAGFLIMAINLLFPNILAENNVPGGTTIAIQIVWVVFLCVFAYSQIFNIKTTKRHIVALVFGCLFLFILFTPLHEFGMAGNPDATTGMLGVGLVALVLLIVWRHRVLQTESVT
jgi:hypothetical protein